ncbi:MAG TPA: class I SAM-dependent methyltransferase family protein [Candidatus Bathyarchaeia archaeon]|nr:class I SAM-dependent methyltransferase family protein [Candidatus Bathyarchaeia archaeon]
MPRESLCIKVPKIHGEKTLVLTNKFGLSDREFEIQNDSNSIYIPIARQPSQEETAIFEEQTSDFQLDVRVFQERARREKTLVEVLENQLPHHLLATLPKALDIVGDIAIIEVPPELKTHEKALGAAILQTHKNVRTVLAKAGAIGGTYRLREFDTIAGENKTSTIHKEFGCQYHVDVAKAYFSPRLSHEHKRVASLVQKGETVVDLFAGVGPFVVLIAKNNEDVKVYAVDINPDAVELLKRNVRLNRVENRVSPILGDARQIVEEKLLGVADRVIMNLPESAVEFVDVACKALKPEGGVVHFYGFVRSPDSVEELKNRFSESVEKTGRKVKEPISAKTVRETAPYEMQVVLDAKII